jgi:hypothetical protein
MGDRLPRTLLHAEGVAVAAAAIALYFHTGYPWWLLVALALAPDYGLKYRTGFKDTHLQRV